MFAPPPVVWLGRTALAFGQAAAEVLGLLFGAVVLVPWLVGRRGGAVFRQVLLEQIVFTGAHALPMMGVGALALGTLIVTQVTAYVPADYAPRVCATLLAREVVPLATAMVLVGRSATAISVELASMTIAGEVAGLRAVGIAVEHVIVLPRLIASVVAALALSLYGLVVGLVLGFALGRLLVPIPFGLGVVLDALDLRDVRLALVKVALFGAGVALVAVREGLAVRAARVELPRAATRAAVRGVVLCLVLNSALSLAS